MKESEHLRLNEIKWDSWAPIADGKGWKYEYLRKAQNHVLSLTSINENMNFLDIGCGTGWAVGQAAKMVNNNGQFYGLDLSTKMIEKAKENFKGFTNFHFIKANSESIPLDNDLFDIIICTNSFHHYLHPDKVMKEIHRILKKAGKIYILDLIADNLLIKALDKIMKWTEPAHVKMYSSKEFCALMENAGIKYIGCDKTNKHHKVQIGEK
jgi:ubiquinone/menaquinone biosynthesis C-methylase UbiE